MPVPIVVAWADAELAEFDGQMWWGFTFELIVGASGFYAQNRLHGFCGFESELMPADGSCVSEYNLPTIISAWETEPEQLETYVSDIRAAYLAHMRKLGLVLTVEN